MGRRPPLLDPETKLLNRQRTLRRYAEKQAYRQLFRYTSALTILCYRNAEKLRQSAQARMQRRRAAIAESDLFTRRKYRKKAVAASERYRDRKAAAEREERCAADCIKQRGRKQEAEALRKKHASVPSQALQAPVNSICRPGLKVAMPWPLRRHASLRDDEDEDADDSSPDNDDSSPSRRPLPPLFEGRPPCPAVCRKCGLDGCSGCACMCEESGDWFDHPDGHFFRKCVQCGGDDCPGCACICKKSSVYVEHGGHLPMKRLKVSA
ncbi:hypothetical protein B0H14DRAFT_2555793 [Mycena olivaceomarginata]|nr:hypothetical protein B0H14DRAFT_2555793 [Mycena olivaceomarginata]